MKPLFDPQTSAVASLTGVCPVIPGAIVSKSLLNSDELKVIVFALDEGQEISEHQTPMLATAQVLDGRLQFDVAGAAHDMGPNDWLIIPPGAPHALRCTAPCRFLLTMVGRRAPQ